MLLGKRLIEKGIVTEEQLRECLEAQERLIGAGLEKLLGDILIAKGFATPDDIIEVLKEQEKQIVVCGACRVEFNVRNEDLGTEVTCPSCGKKVLVPAKLSDITVARPAEPTYVDLGGAPVAYVQVKYFDREDEVVALREGDSIVIGSSPAADVPLDGEGVLEEHCTIEVKTGTTYLTNLMPDGETFVNGKRVEKCTIKPGDMILVGRVPLMISAGLPRSSGFDVSPLSREVLFGEKPAYLIGRTIGGYRIIRVLGQGGMSVVYLAEQLSLNRLVALKVLKAEVGKTQKAIDRFFREALAGAKLNHPNIVQVYDFGNIGGLLFISMEYVPGQDVNEWVKQYGPLPINLALSIAIQVADALQFAHSMGVIHRDVKLSNMIFSDNGRVKLLDLGIARVLEDAVPESRRAALGTLAYMPPEQTRDASSVDERGDMYSLGASLYKMLTGHPPFRRKTVTAMLKAIRKEPPPDPRLVRPEISEALAKVILTALAKKPRDRFRDMETFRNHLRSVWSATLGA